WRIENSLHWVLDVSMGEDACRIWQDHAPENMATLRRTAVSLLKQERSNHRGIKARSKKACLDDDYRLKVLVG
ncbi:MAG: transposase, partial [Armatimonadetes bacterium]|nr:transposase [Armatimonadota bacterium]